MHVIYFSSRDHLIDQLVTDAFTTFNAAQVTARDSVPRDDPIGRLSAMCQAYRQWARSYPQQYRLIFTVVPPVAFRPTEFPAAPAATGLTALAETVECLRQAGRLRGEGLPGAVAPVLEALISPVPGELHPHSMSAALLIWSRLHGLLALELTGRPPGLPDMMDDLFRYEVEATLRCFFDGRVDGESGEPRGR